MLLDLIIRRRFHRRRLRHDKPSPLTKVHENRTLVPRPTSAEPLNPVAFLLAFLTGAFFLADACRLTLRFAARRVATRRAAAGFRADFRFEARM